MMFLSPCLFRETRPSASWLYLLRVSGSSWETDGLLERPEWDSGRFNMFRTTVTNIHICIVDSKILPNKRYLIYSVTFSCSSGVLAEYIWYCALTRSLHVEAFSIWNVSRSIITKTSPCSVQSQPPLTDCVELTQRSSRLLGINTWDVSVALTNLDWSLFNSVHEVSGLNTG